MRVKMRVMYVEPITVTSATGDTVTMRAVKLCHVGPKFAEATADGVPAAQDLAHPDSAHATRVPTASMEFTTADVEMADALKLYGEVYVDITAAK